MIVRSRAARRACAFLGRPYTGSAFAAAEGGRAMGSRASRNNDAAVDKAAKAIQDATAILVFTGAGMGVDSGLGTFRGRNAGVWPPLKVMGMDFPEMSNPDWFYVDPRLAWNFWKYRFEAYTGSEPHNGYRLLRKWGEAKPGGMFSVTSNIDGHWARVVGGERVLEVHGSVLFVQALYDSKPGDIRPTDASQVAGLTVPPWDLSPGEPVEFSTATATDEDAHSSNTPLQDGRTWHQGRVGPDGVSVIKQGITNPRARATALRRPGGSDLFRIDEACSLPRTTQGRLLRPNVLMFGDSNMNFTRIDEQQTRYEQWLNGVGGVAGLGGGGEGRAGEQRVVVVEVGAGKAVPTIRQMAEQVVSSCPEATLIRINLDDSDVPARLRGRSVSVALGALAALQSIDEVMGKQNEGTAGDAG